MLGSAYFYLKCNFMGKCAECKRRLGAASEHFVCGTAYSQPLKITGHRSQTDGLNYALSARQELCKRRPICISYWCLDAIKHLVCNFC